MSKRRTSSSEFKFEVGDRVLLTLIKRQRKFIIPVVISKVACLLSVDSESSSPLKSTVTGYIVSSGRGGELQVGPSELRPDTVLDRITIALSEGDELSSEGLRPPASVSIVDVGNFPGRTGPKNFGVHGR
jgi:hypothetical protein